MRWSLCGDDAIQETQEKPARLADTIAISDESASRAGICVTEQSMWSHQEQAMRPYTSAHELHVMLSIDRTPGNAAAEEIDPHTMLSNIVR